ncbi:MULTISPECIES: MerR family transcriptional regulator [unclassified Streptomyces]|uniref:MerR family transcriptional regulator n=1 Tax=unclassified Streptomyces TaxID=2593676 RepID=UPI00339F3F87
MAWSTREIAELAGTSLRTVRHYHEVGLLNEPERRSNGYKQYGVAHLVRLLRIKRLTGLGFSLTQIAAMRDDEHPRDALRALDAELAATIERLQLARAEVGALLRTALPHDLSLPFAPAGASAELPDPDRSFVTVMSSVLGPSGLRAYTDMLHQAPDASVAVELDRLPADADEQTRRDLADRLVPFVRALHAKHPGLGDLSSDAPRGRNHAAETIGKAIDDLYNPAQVDVMRRLRVLLSQPGKTGPA